MNEFPYPFGGIEYAVRYDDDKAFAQAINHLLSGCGDEHMHNFAVQHDGLVIHISKLGKHCLENMPND